MIMGLRCPTCWGMLGPATDFADLVRITRDHSDTCTGPIRWDQHPDGRPYSDEEMAEMDRTGQPYDLPRRQPG